MRVIPIKANGAIKGSPNSKIYSVSLLDVGDNLFFDECDIFKFTEKNNRPHLDIPTGAPPEGYAESLASVEHAKANVVSYYIDSVSWDGDYLTRDETGSGTIDDPWKNLDFAIEKAYRKASCLASMCCDFFVRLRVKGTVDYRFGSYDSNTRMILTPWEDVEITSGTGVDDSQPYWTASGNGFNFGGYVMSCRYTFMDPDERVDINAGMMYNCTFRGAAGHGARVSANSYRCHIFADSTECSVSGTFVFNCKVTGDNVLYAQLGGTYVYNTIIDVKRNEEHPGDLRPLRGTVVYNSSSTASAYGDVLAIGGDIVLDSTASATSTAQHARAVGIEVDYLVYGCSVTCSSNGHFHYEHPGPNYGMTQASAYSFGIEPQSSYDHSDAATVAANNNISVSSAASVEIDPGYVGYWAWIEWECDVRAAGPVCINCRHDYMRYNSGGVVQNLC